MGRNGRKKSRIQKNEKRKIATDKIRPGLKACFKASIFCREVVFSKTTIAIKIKAGTKEFIKIVKAGKIDWVTKNGSGKSNANARKSFESPALQSPESHKRKPNRNARAPFNKNAGKENPFKKLRKKAATIAGKTMLFLIIPFFKSVYETIKPTRQMNKIFRGTNAACIKKTNLTAC